MTASSNIDNTEYLQWFEELLVEGKRVHVRVKGMSMFPWLLSRDVVCVQRVEKSLLTPGRVILFQETKGWVAHRLWSTDVKNNLFITRGDANLRKDKPIKYEEIKGIVTGVIHQKLFWSKWAVGKNGILLAKTAVITAPLFWMMGRVAVWIWKWVKKIKRVE